MFLELKLVFDEKDIYGFRESQWEFETDLFQVQINDGPKDSNIFVRDAFTRELTPAASQIVDISIKNDNFVLLIEHNIDIVDKDCVDMFGEEYCEKNTFSGCRGDENMILGCKKLVQIIVLKR